MSSPETVVKNILARADITVNGNRKGDITVHDSAFYSRVVSSASLGLGESYVEGMWDCDSLDTLFYKLLSARIDREAIGFWTNVIPGLKARLFNMQSKSRAFEVGEKHYDMGNDLYKAMLGKRMVYTCGYWKYAKNLDEAQEAKLDLVCKKIGLRPGMKVLDIGCGWGSFAKFAAKKYKARVVGITISKEQVALGNELCKGLPVEIRLQDYRDVNEKFDRIVSLGMFEHVGPKNYREYMQIVSRCLEDDGLFLLHTIGSAEISKTLDAWMIKYIFPNGVIPGIKDVASSIEDLFVMEDWHNFGADYDKTLMAWHSNFVKAWPSLKKTYGDRFYRMWTYYLLACAGTFRARRCQLWQIVLTKNGIPGGYSSLR
jgi:cyclopropane-fatty-acyl-phospholipid synthase